MVQGNSVRNKSRKLTTELASLRRQKRTRGKYKNKLSGHMGVQQCIWAVNPWHLSWTALKTSRQKHPLRGLQLGTTNLGCRSVLIWHEMGKSFQTVRPGDSPHTERSQVWPFSEWRHRIRKQQTGCCSCSDALMTPYFPINLLPLKVTLAKGSECLRLLARCRRQRNMAGNTPNADRCSKKCFTDESPDMQHQLCGKSHQKQMASCYSFLKYQQIIR